MSRTPFVSCVLAGLVMATSPSMAIHDEPSAPPEMPRGLAKALLASGPDPRLKSDLDLFGQFVGNWRVDVVNHLPDGTIQHVDGEWHFGWILNGTAVQDVWMIPTRAHRDRGEPLAGYGTTLRFYDPRIDAWRTLWASASYRNVIVFTARRQNGEIVMEADGAQPPLRWIFSDVTPDSFRWRSVQSKDGWKTVELQQEMTVHRIDRIDKLAEVLPAAGPARGFEAENATFGQFVGDWTISHEGFLPDGTIRETDGSLHVGWVLDGRIVQDVWRFRDPETNEFVAGTTVRLYDARVGAWHSVWFYPAGHVIQAFIARPSQGTILLDGSTPTGAPEQWIFSDIKPSSFDWRAIQSDDNRTTWRVTEHMRIKRTATQSSRSR